MFSVSVSVSDSVSIIITVCASGLIFIAEGEEKGARRMDDPQGLCLHNRVKHRENVKERLALTQKTRKLVIQTALYDSKRIPSHIATRGARNICRLEFPSHHTQK